MGYNYGGSFSIRSFRISAGYGVIPLSVINEARGNAICFSTSRVAMFFRFVNMGRFNFKRGGALGRGERDAINASTRFGDRGLTDFSVRNMRWPTQVVFLPVGVHVSSAS